MKVNIAVCGKFHYHNYVRYVDQAGLLNRFYYSHSVGTNAARLGISPDRAVNSWPKEYLIRLHGILTRGWLIPELAPLYASLWQVAALRRWDRCEALHLMLHGTGLRLIRRAKREGAIVIAEPVNQHPHGQNEILREEAERLGLKVRRRLHAIQENQIEEAALADFLLAPSRIVRDSFVQRGYEQTKTAVLSYGVDLNSFHPLVNGRESNGTFRVICVAQVSLRKGQLYLLEAWKRLKLRDAELLLIGTISYDMNSIMHQYDGLFRHIQFVPNHELHNYYGRSSVLVLPSLEDGFGYVVAEAMACGLPVITTANTGATDVIRDGKEGFVIPIRSPEAIAQRLELLYRNKPLREEMAGAALTKARGELSWAKYARRLCRFYRWLLGEGSSRTFPTSDQASDIHGFGPAMAAPNESEKPLPL